MMVPHTTSPIALVINEKQKIIREARNWIDSKPGAVIHQYHANENLSEWLLKLAKG